MQMNAINVIAPYKHHGQWVFDDPRMGGAAFGLQRLIKRLINPSRQHVGVAAWRRDSHQALLWNGMNAAARKCESNCSTPASASRTS
jgi:hypothetical protein